MPSVQTEHKFSAAKRGSDRGVPTRRSTMKILVTCSGKRSEEESVAASEASDPEPFFRALLPIGVCTGAVVSPVDCPPVFRVAVCLVLGRELLQGSCLERRGAPVLGFIHVLGVHRPSADRFCPVASGPPGEPAWTRERETGSRAGLKSQELRNFLQALREHPLNDTIDDLTVAYEDDNGHLIIKELDKVVLTRGAWTTILFRYQEWRPDRDDYGPDKYTLRRYKKSAGTYRPQSKFTISSPDQARKIIDALNGWLGEAEEK